MKKYSEIDEDNIEKLKRRQNLLSQMKYFPHDMKAGDQVKMEETLNQIGKNFCLMHLSEIEDINENGIEICKDFI